MNKNDRKVFALGVGVGAVVLLIAIFATGWVITSGSAKANAQAASAEAVMDRLAPIAIAQFMKDPDREIKLTELKKLDSWGENNRTDFVEKQGWATMPGEKTPDSKVAEECARRLKEMK